MSHRVTSRPSCHQLAFRLSLALFLVFLGAPLAFAAPVGKRSSNAPGISSNFQDPSVLLTNNVYYAFAGINGNPEAINILLATSPDLSNWKVQHGYDALPRAGSWAANPPRVWAPDVIQLRSGSFVMYYSAAAAASPGKHCVGAATAASAEGPYQPQNAPLFCDLGAGGAIDADGFTDPQSQKQYIVYKVDGNSVGHGGACSNSVDPIAPTPLILQEVSPNDGYSFIGSSVQLLVNDASDGPNIEAPSLMYDQSSSTYFLFYNSRCFTKEDYSIRYATSKNIQGPYTKQATPFLQTGNTNAKVFIPGSIDFVKGANQAVFHGDLNMGWFKGDGSKRVRGLYSIDLALSGGKLQAGSLI